ncbi:hypothetical protein D3C87_1984260 [compost metagenome]
MQYRRVDPHPRFHFTAVDAAVAREIDKNGFVDLFGIGQCFLVVVEAFQLMRQMEEVSIFAGFA